MPNLTGGMQNAAHWWPYAPLYDNIAVATTYISANGGGTEPMPVLNHTIRIANNSDVGIYVLFTDSAVVPSAVGMVIPAGQIEYFNYNNSPGRNSYMWIKAVSGTGKHVNIALMRDRNLGSPTA